MTAITRKPHAGGRGASSVHRNRIEYGKPTTSRLPQNWRERIARTIDPLAFWQSHLPGQPLRPNATGWCAVRCPWHEDGSPSASVNIRHGGFFCHACGVKYDLIGACLKFRGGQFHDAVFSLLRGGA